MKNDTDIQAAMGRLVARFRDTVCKGYAVEAEQTAKVNAPWEDRTGDARKLIKGVALGGEDITLDTYKQEDGKTVKSGTVTIDGKDCVGIALVHRVEYGKYLERDGDWQYAVLKPTIEAIRPRFMAAARQVFGGRR